MKLKIELVLCLICVIKLDVCVGYRILGIFPINVKSHMMMFEQLMKGLALRGHQVDVVSTFGQKTPIPNYSDIILPSVLPKVVNNKSYADLERSTDNNNMVYGVTTKFGNFNCEKGLHDPQLQKIINNPPDNPPYDLVIVEVILFNLFYFYCIVLSLNIFLLVNYLLSRSKVKRKTRKILNLSSRVNLYFICFFFFLLSLVFYRSFIIDIQMF